MSAEIEALLCAASEWERARSNWRTRSIREAEPRPPTTQAQMREAEEKLAAAVRKWRVG